MLLSFVLFFLLYCFLISTGRGHTVSTPASTQDSTKLQELQSTIQSLQEEAEIQHRKHSDLMASLEEAKHHRAQLEREKEEAAAENAELLQNYSRLQKSVSELQARVQEQEGKSMLKAQQDNEIQTLRKALAGMQNLGNCAGYSFLYILF